MSNPLMACGRELVIGLVISSFDLRGENRCLGPQKLCVIVLKYIPVALFRQLRLSKLPCQRKAKWIEALASPESRRFSRSKLISIRFWIQFPTL